MERTDDFGTEDLSGVIQVFQVLKQWREEMPRELVEEVEEAAAVH